MPEPVALPYEHYRNNTATSLNLFDELIMSG